MKYALTHYHLKMTKKKFQMCRATRKSKENSDVNMSSW